MHKFIQVGFEPSLK